MVEAQPQDSQEQQDQSVADAARRSRTQKKDAAKQSRVISNEDLDLEYFKPGQEGLYLGAPPKLKAGDSSASAVATAEAADQPSASTNNEPRPNEKNSEEAASEDAGIAKLKKQIAEAEDHLKWQQREFALDQDMVYSNPNYTDNQTGKTKLDSEQQSINQMHQEIGDLKANLAALQERRMQASPPESLPSPAPPQL
ncbi:MAG TPA: hypothetical protein VJW94_04620 [Candidatus Acidoferrum sp.]|nr:hypothetical protein [Candidatus Acidoferrum sp.]